MNVDAAKAVRSWNPVSDRIITVRLESLYTKTTVMQVYAPTNAAETAEEENFYEQLQQVVGDIQTHNLNIGYWWETSMTYRHMT